MSSSGKSFIEGLQNREKRKKQFLSQKSKPSILNTFNNIDYLEYAYNKYKTSGRFYHDSLIEIARDIGSNKISEKQELNFHNLISIAEEKLNPEQRRTNSINVQIMQAFAKHLKPNGPYADMAVGMGGLIWGLKNVAHIQDVNYDFASVAKVVSTYCENEPRCEMKDSISEEYPYFLDGAVFLFDPPMGQSRVKPGIWKDIKTTIPLKTKVGNDIITKSGDTLVAKACLSEVILGDYNSDSTSLTENMFITNFLLKASPQDYFICLVPESFLTRNEKEHNNLRKYLVQNSLIAVIKLKINQGVNTVILVGQKYKEGKHGEQIKLITSENNNIEEILNAFEANESYESEDKKCKSICINIEEIAASANQDYILNMPIIIKDDKKIIRHPKEIIQDIKTNELTLKPLRVKIICPKFLEFLKDNDKNKEVVVDNKFWFEEEKYNDNSIINLVRIFYKDDILILNKKNKGTLDISYINNFDDLKNIMILSSVNIIKIKGDDFIVDVCKKNVLNNRLYLKSAPEELYKRLKVNKHVSSLISILDPIAQEVYADICKFYSIDENQDNTIIKKYPLSQILRSLELLSKMLLISPQTKKNSFVYKNFKPLYPFFDGEI
ncbi:MAG: hypothetical protein R3Y43_07515 [Alphaproteobacteria bacterium]